MEGQDVVASLRCRCDPRHNVLVPELERCPDKPVAKRWVVHNRVDPEVAVAQQHRQVRLRAAGECRVPGALHEVGVWYLVRTLAPPLRCAECARRLALQEGGGADAAPGVEHGPTFHGHQPVHVGEEVGVAGVVDGRTVNVSDVPRRALVLLGDEGLQVPSVPQAHPVANPALPPNLLGPYLQRGPEG